jgi:hypothetical protein
MDVSSGLNSIFFVDYYRCSVADWCHATGPWIAIVKKSFATILKEGLNKSAEDVLDPN